MKRVTAPSVAATPASRPRRHFRLPPEDEAFLNSAGLMWETVTEASPQQQVRRLVMYGFPVPPGYTPSVVDLFLRIEPGYPDTQIDMVYFHPALVKVSGGGIKNLSGELFDGRDWQRWSRHRTGENPWRPGLDCVETHLALVRTWLIRELP